MDFTAKIHELEKVHTRAEALAMIFRLLDEMGGYDPETDTYQIEDMDDYKVLMVLLISVYAEKPERATHEGPDEVPLG